MRVNTYILRAIVITGVLCAPWTWADEMQVPQPRVIEADDEASPAPSDPVQSGRVIEFKGGVDAGSDVIRAKVQANTPSSTEGPAKQGQKANQTNSVKLITGGDPSDGNAKSGRLPILD